MIGFTGESIPIRLFLSPYELTPTHHNINNKFSVKYFLNLVLVDEEDRRYFKQQEITMYRLEETSWTIIIQRTSIRFVEDSNKEDCDEHWRTLKYRNQSVNPVFSWGKMVWYSNMLEIQKLQWCTLTDLLFNIEGSIYFCAGSVISMKMLLHMWSNINSDIFKTRVSVIWIVLPHETMMFFFSNYFVQTGYDVGLLFCLFKNLHLFHFFHLFFVVFGMRVTGW